MDHVQAFERFRGKRGLVMGLGVFGGGVEAARFLGKYCSHVVVTDLRDENVLADSIAALEGLPIEYRLGEHRKQDFEHADVVIHSPAVRPDNPLLQAARDRGAEVTMEMSLFMEACPATTVGITGSNGKTTTALLAYEMLCEVMQRAQPEFEGCWADKGADPVFAKTETGFDPLRRVWLGGNCGEPLINHVEEMTKDDVVVLELSSFQLQDWHRIRKSCDISVITNITPNHLDWHRDMDEYIWAKSAIYLYSAGTVVLNADRPELKDLARVDGLAMRSYGGNDSPARRSSFRLPGEFNWSNAMAATAAVKEVAEIDVAASLKRFRGVEHRLEYCGNVNGARCYNDSIATTPESTIAALSAFPDQPILLILGGSDKGLNFDALAQAIYEHRHVQAVAIQGPNAQRLKKACFEAHKRKYGSAGGLDGNWRTKIGIVPTFDAACEMAFAAAKPSWVILMSPASASFYEYAPNKRFTNFEHRGRHFKALVKAHALDRA